MNKENNSRRKNSPSCFNQINEKDNDSLLFSSFGYPRVAKAHEIGDQGEDIVKNILSNIAVCYPFGNRQYGLDILCQLKDNYQVSSKYFFIQVKSTQKTSKNCFTHYFNKKHLNLWCASPLPVYVFFVNVKYSSIISWINIVECVSRIDLPKIIEKKGYNVPIEIKKSFISQKELLLSFIENINTHYKMVDSFARDLISMESIKSKNKKLDKCPRILRHIENKLESYYLNIPINTRVLLIEAFFALWQKLENRFGMFGYPTKIVQIALCTKNSNSIAVGVNSLFYMDSDVCIWDEIQGGLSYAKCNVDYFDRLRALDQALLQFHLSPYAHSGHQTYLDMKISIIMKRIFTIEEIIPAYEYIFHNTYKALRKKSELLRNKIPCNKPNAYVALQIAFMNLCINKPLAKYRPDISKSAIALYNQLIATDKMEEYTWEYKAHLISFNNLFLFGIENREFIEMSDNVKELIMKGIQEHSDPRVRLDCLRIYNKEIIIMGNTILEYINKLIDKTTKEDREYRIEAVKYELNILMTDQAKDKAIVQKKRESMFPKFDGVGWK